MDGKFNFNSVVEILNFITSLTPEKLNEIPLETLETVKAKLGETIKKLKNNKKVEKTIYTCDCFGSSTHHLTKYRHWAKVVQKIDDSENSGYAFKGEFIHINKENLVPVGSFIIETCGNNIRMYKANSQNKELVVAGTYSKLVSFIKECKDVIESNVEETEAN